MADWWTSLLFLEKFYYSIGIFSLLLGFIVAILIVFGIDGTTARVASRVSLASQRFPLFSIHSIAAFLLGFGWGGVVCLKVDLHPIVIGLLSFGLGIFLMVMMYMLILTMLKLQSRSDLDLSILIGAIAEVYSTIPRSRSGKGRIRVQIGDDIYTMDAETNSPDPFKPGDSVRVQERISGSRFLVRER